MDIALIIIVLVLLIYVTVASYFLYKKETEFRHREQELYTEAQRELQRTQQKAIKIVESAVVKGRDLLNQTQSFKQNLENTSNEAVDASIDQFVNQLENNSNIILHEYEGLFDTLKKKFQEDESTAILQLEQAGEKEVEEFAKSIGTKTLAYEQMVEKKVDNELKAAEMLESAVKEQVDEFGKSVADKTELYQKQLEERVEKEIAAATQMEDVVKKEVSDFTKNITDKTLAYQNDLETKVMNEFQLAQQEIKQFKEAEMAKIQEGIVRTTSKLAMELLGKSIRLEDQEKLLLEALDQAKKESIFNY